MVTLVAVHYYKGERLERGMKSFSANDERTKAAKGFVSRQVLRSKNDPTKIATVTTFETMEDYEALFNIDPKRYNRSRTPEDPVELDIYEVISSI